MKRLSPSMPFAVKALTLASGIAIASLFVLERSRPLRKPSRPAARRIARNLAMGALCGAVIYGVETPIVQTIARGNARRPRGLARHAPAILRPLLAGLAMDYSLYLWHIATHRVPFLWKFHRIHHVDPDLDMSTALRFHAIDMLISVPWRMAQVRLSGIQPTALKVWQRFFNFSILFHHANLRLPAPWDRRLAWLITTPEMHGIHHSVVPDERDSNWSSGLSAWDRLHGTLRQDVAQHSIKIGVDDDNAHSDVCIGHALAAPLRRAQLGRD